MDFRPLEQQRMGTPADPFIYAADGDRRMKFCFCGNCMTIAQCTRSFDFYESLFEPGLECEACFQAKIKASGRSLVGFPVQ